MSLTTIIVSAVVEIAIQQYNTLTHAKLLSHGPLHYKTDKTDIHHNPYQKKNKGQKCLV